LADIDKRAGVRKRDAQDYLKRNGVLLADYGYVGPAVVRRRLFWRHAADVEIGDDHQDLRWVVTLCAHEKNIASGAGK